MTNEQIEALLALEAKATPEPWFEQYEYDGSRTVAQMRSTDTLMCVNRATHVEGHPWERTKENAALIAAARNSIRYLCMEVKRLREFARFNRLNSAHKPTHVLRLLNAGEISFGKACEWLEHYADGKEDEIVDMPVGEIPDDVTFAEAWAEVKRLREALACISHLGGNLPDERLTTRTGPNDAVMRGLMIVEARRIAREALGK